MKELPIVCSLSPAALKARREGLLQGLLRRADAYEALPQGYRLRFAPSAGVLQAIAETIEAERQCCRFLRFTVAAEPDEGPISLELEGPPGTREFLSAMLDV